MYNSDTELLFPSRIVPGLRSLRGKEWNELIDRVLQKNQQSIDLTAFVLMMVRLNGCVSCNVDSFRAMRGCTQCAQQVVRRFRGEDSELVEQFERAFNDVKIYKDKVSL